MDYGRANLGFAGALLGAAVQRGLRHVVICPGSRSTPLALAAAVHPGLKSYVLIDERSAAFFALGMARQLGEPVGLICTSGTAAANFHPAVIEAYLSRVPLLVLTADRPAELRDWGASQTIDQVELYGSHTCWSRDLPPPVGDAMEVRFAQATAARAMEIAGRPAPGPVHLNVQFREPLIPQDADPLAQLRDLFATYETTLPLQFQVSPPAPADTDRLVALLRKHSRGIIVCGPHVTSELGETVAELSDATGYPCLADPLSTVRFSWPSHCGLIDAYDLFLRDAELAARLTPDLVLRIGAMPTSKPLSQFLARLEAPVIAVDPAGLRDAGHAVSWHLATDELATVRAVTTALRADECPAQNPWRSTWQEANGRTRQAIEEKLASQVALSEPLVAASLVDCLPEGTTLVVGNSMPVRDVDTFAAGGNRSIRVAGTRGASGIDGVTSTALGAAAVASGPVALLIGDLSFLHDLGGLQAAAYAKTPVVLIVINNNGGGIFSFLPQRTQVEHKTFEQLFGTPAAVDIEGTARLFRCDFARPASLEAFRSVVRRGTTTQGVTIVEVQTNRAENLSLHRDIAAGVIAELADLGVA